MPASPFQPALDSYDHVLVGFSGGKDSIACVLHLLESGVDPTRIELHHHEVDGAGPTFMDWPCTRGYCEAVATALGLRIYFSHREGGFLREMGRFNSPTAPVLFETPQGSLQRAGGRSQKLGTRGLFPQVSPSLAVRYCSPALKIGVMDALIQNQDRFLERHTLVVTGERAEESPGRAGYAIFEPHRTDLRSGARKCRLVDHWRPVHSWSEEAVWAIIKRHRINPHVAYQLGWSRLSCRTCIFLSPSAWATLRAVFPEAFDAIADREARSGKTIQRKASIIALADSAQPFSVALARPDLVRQANAAAWTLPVRLPPGAWRLPAGAYGDGAGPS